MVIIWAVLLAGGLLFIALVVLFMLYTSGRMQRAPEWTGFGYNNKNHESQPGKTLWDWLQLLIIPIFSATIVFAFNAGQESMNQQIEQKRGQEQVIDTYLDNMSNLLLVYNLHDSRPNGSVRTTAQAITLTALERLDTADLKGNVILFLYRADLIKYHFNYQADEPKRPDKDKPIITLPYANLEGAKLNDFYLGNVDLHNMHLSGADFHGSWLGQADLGASIADNIDLRNAFMKGANLYHTSLVDAKLQGAILQKANIPGALLSRAQFSDADLSKANLGVYINPTNQEKFSTQLDSAILNHVNLEGTCLIEANLSNAILIEANLSNADLTGANLSNADLTGANLRGAKVSFEQLAKTQSLTNAIMPNGIRHP